MAPIFENTDLLAHTCGLLDAADIARLCQSCRFVPEHIRDVKTIKFLSTMRSDAVLGNLSTIERLALVESLRECSTCIAFKVFSCDLLEASLAPLQRFAALMQRHRSFSVSIEAHCGLEAPRDAGYIFARERGRNVKIALLACGLEPERLQVISYGNRRPLVWAFGNPSDEKDAGSPTGGWSCLFAVPTASRCPHASRRRVRVVEPFRHRSRRPGHRRRRRPGPGGGALRTSKKTTGTRRSPTKKTRL